MSRFLFFAVCSIVFLPLQASPQNAPAVGTASAAAAASVRRPDAPENSLLKIGSQEEFDRVARTFHPNTPYAIPHVMFALDRRDADRIYFINTRRFKFHKDFLYATGLAPLGTDMYKAVYTAPERRFIVGTIAWQRPIEKWTWELWEGDTATAEMLGIAQAAIDGAFFGKASFKPNSSLQEEQARVAALSTTTQDDINKGQEYLALNPGTAIGRIHIIEKLDDTVEIGDNEIVILKELPVTLPPVAGIIVAKPSTPLSHVNILAKGWGVPNLYIKDADKLFKEFNTRWIKLEATYTGYSYQFADKSVLDQYKPPDIRQAPVDLAERRVTSLGRMRKKDSVVFGAKAANLGEMMNSGLAGFEVPDGFSIPFHWYDRFARENGIEQTILGLLDDIDFVHNPRFRRQKLEEIRAKFQKGSMNPGLREVIVKRWKEQLKGRPVFVRSSSNTEDLPNFSGAGLYSSVANVRNEEQLIEAVKKVWGSLWKFEAYEARVRNYVDQQSVHMSVLVQLGVDMERGGVMFSRDPFDPGRKGFVYISSVCGHNDQITANGGMPEQVIVDTSEGTVSTLTFSQIGSALRFSEKGGLREAPGECASQETRRILSDSQARSLAAVALRVKGLFGGSADQDIEWGIIGRRIYLVQTRPYFEK